MILLKNITEEIGHKVIALWNQGHGPNSTALLLRKSGVQGIASTTITTFLKKNGLVRTRDQARVAKNWLGGTPTIPVSETLPKELRNREPKNRRGQKMHRNG